MATKICVGCNRTGGKADDFCKKCGERLVLKADLSPASAKPDVLDDAALDALEDDPDGTVPSPTISDPAGLPFGPEPDDASDVSPSSPPDHASNKAFVATAENGLSAGRALEIVPGRAAVLGTGKDADLVLEGDEYASRRHATLVLRDGRLMLTDNDSTNGTFIQVKGTREVRAGDAVIIGKSLVRIGQKG